MPVKVTFAARGKREIWKRDFAGRRFSSIQSEGTGRSARMVCESFGPFSFDLAPVVERDRLLLVPRGWKVFGIGLPAAFGPYGNSYEHVEDGRFAFHVEIRVPLAGLIVSYRGQLEPPPGSP